MKNIHRIQIDYFDTETGEFYEKELSLELNEFQQVYVLMMGNVPVFLSVSPEPMEKILEERGTEYDGRLHIRKLDKALITINDFLGQYL